MKQPSVYMLVTELRQAGNGTLEDTPVQFFWRSSEHASAIGDINLHLQVKTSRHEIPGSNKVVEHALAATWQPFEITGEWDDKWGNRRSPSNTVLTNSGPYAISMFKEFAAMVTRMPLVRIEIDALSFVGLLTDLKLKYRTQTFIAWTATMSPHANEIVTVDRPKTVSSQSLVKWASDAAEQRDRIKLLFDDITNAPGATLPAIAFKTNQLDDFTLKLLEVNDSIDRMQGLIEDGFHTETESKLLLMASTFRRIRASSTSAITFLKNSTPDNNIGYEDAITEMRLSEWYNGSVEQFWRMVGLASQAELDVRLRARQRPRAIYYPKAGESLERISLKFYGTADAWRAIYDKNNLSSIILTGDEELIIPERAS